MLKRSMSLRSQQEAFTLPRDNIHNPTLLDAPALALKYIAIDSRLEVVLQVWERIQVEVEEAFAISVSNSSREEVS